MHGCQKGRKHGRLLQPLPPAATPRPPQALIPFFNQLSGLKGGACMVPLCFILPIALWCTYNKGFGASKLRLALNYTLIAVFSCIALVATVGSGALRRHAPARGGGRRGAAVAGAFLGMG